MKTSILIGAALCVAVAVASAVLAQEPGVRPQMIIQASDTDPCGNGVVRGLDPKGDGFLTVKSAPGLRYRRIDKLFNGDQVYLCAKAGDWLGVVYTRTRQDCNVVTPWPKSLPYTGPCRSGWVHSHWIEVREEIQRTRAFEQYDPTRPGKIVDLLKSGETGPRVNKRCALQIDGINVLCDLVWYIEFKGDGYSVQFNKGTGEKPVVSFFGMLADPDTITIDAVQLRLGDGSVAMNEYKATGQCLVGKVIVNCQARLSDGSDGRLLVGTIVPISN